MYYGAHESWNLRDQHMYDTLERILAMRGPKSKIVVWAHNSHIGDARYTEMGAARSELNIASCAGAVWSRRRPHRLRHHSGSVLAASDWDSPAEVKAVRPSMPESFEALFHDAGIARFLVDLRMGHNEAVRDDLRIPRLERYIGVVYRPESERMSHYAHASLSDQYDGFVWFDETQAVTPLIMQVSTGEDETYPLVSEALPPSGSGAMPFGDDVDPEQTDPPSFQWTLMLAFRSWRGVSEDGATFVRSTTSPLSTKDRGSLNHKANQEILPL